MKSPIDGKRLSDMRFAALGTPDLVYIRPIQNEGGDRLYSIHAADGRPLVVIDNLEEAVLTARMNDFHAVTVH